MTIHPVQIEAVYGYAVTGFACALLATLLVGAGSLVLIGTGFEPDRSRPSVAVLTGCALALVFALAGGAFSAYRLDQAADSAHEQAQAQAQQLRDAYDLEDIEMLGAFAWDVCRSGDAAGQVRHRALAPGTTLTSVTQTDGTCQVSLVRPETRP